MGIDATCQICLKTKFADGVGHSCNYCGVRCCARCGGKVTLRSSKVREDFIDKVVLALLSCPIRRLGLFIGQGQI